MDLILTVPGVTGLFIHALTFIYFARVLPLGALSLPRVTVLTSLCYFYVMPITAVSVGADAFFGSRLTSLEETHWVTSFYILGAAAAFIVTRKQLYLISRPQTGSDTSPNRLAYLVLWGLVGLSIAMLYILGQFNVMRDETYEFASETSNLGFLNLGFSMSLSLTLIFLIRDNFGPRSLTLLCAIFFLYSIAAFRFRILILLCATAICFTLVRKIRIRIWMVLLGSVGGIMLMNLVGMARRYGAGLDIGQIESKSFAEIFSNFGGEIGIVHVTQYTAANPFSDLIWFDPWTVALARFVPKFFWPDKPIAAYLALFSSGFTEPGAIESGMAAPQHVEMIYQFGWLGVPILAFFYFSVATRLSSFMIPLGRDARIAGASLLPPFFGYYMQSRGYFFQTSAEAIFTFAPIFLLHMGRTDGRRHWLGRAAGIRSNGKRGQGDASRNPAGLASRRIIAPFGSGGMPQRHELRESREPGISRRDHLDRPSRSRPCARPR